MLQGTTMSYPKVTFILYGLLHNSLRVYGQMPKIVFLGYLVEVYLVNLLGAYLPNTVQMPILI